MYPRLFTSRLMHIKVLWLTFYILSGAKKFFSASKNPLKTLCLLSGFLDESDITLRYLGKVHFDRSDVEENLLQTVISACSKNLTLKQQKNLISIINQRNNKIIKIDHISLERVTPLFILIEIFVLEDYKFHNLEEGDVVVDVGASVADSSLYLAKEGYEVYAFEPVPEVYKIGQKNLKLNPHLAKRIHYINKAVTANKEKARIGYDEIRKSHIASIHDTRAKNIEIDSIGVKEIIDLEPQGLKLDCEGCEYEIMEKLDPSLFEEIIIEYHPQPKNRRPKRIIDKLESHEFKIYQRGNYNIGLIHAWKKI